MSNPNAKGRPRVNDPFINRWHRKMSVVDKAWFQGEIDKIKADHGNVVRAHKDIESHAKKVLNMN